MSAEKQEIKYTVSIYDEDTVLTEHESGKRFLVSEEQLMGFFRTEIALRPEKGLLYKSTDGVRSTYTFRIPKQKNKTLLLKLKDKISEIQMDIPATIMKAQVMDGQVQDMRIWAYSGKLSPETNLYELPLPNVSGSAVCLGATNKTVEGGLRESLMEIFFDSPFNSHHFEAGNEGLNFLEFHEKYKGRMPLRKLEKIGKISSVCPFLFDKTY